jgi:UDP-glucose 4-epimerase
VLDLVRLVGRTVGAEVPHRLGRHRTGDVARTVAHLGRAEKPGLAPRLSLEEAVASAWESWRRHPAGLQVSGTVIGSDDAVSRRTTDVRVRGPGTS